MPTELVQVQGLAKRYGDATVFDGVNFTLTEGEFVCIIGHSGCGKTTILRQDGFVMSGGPTPAMP